MNAWFLPIRILVYTLILLALGASYSWNGLDIPAWLVSLRNLTALLFSGWFATSVLHKLRLAIPSRTEHRIITSLILFLLFDSLFPWWLFFLLGATTEILQRLIRVPSGPIFNPAAFSALVFSFFGFFPSWWGTNFSPRFPLVGEGVSVAVLITLPLAGYVAYRYRKHLISITALIIFCIVYLFLFEQNPLYIALEGTLLFYLLIMAVEPRTSPVIQKEQLLYGALIGILLPLGIYFHWLEAYTIALLVANFYTKRNQIKELFA